MRTNFRTGILDIDPKGTTGRGTQFWLEINVIEDNKTSTERHEYFLLDILEKKFDIDSIKRPYLERQRIYDQELDKQAKNAKLAAETERKESIKSNPELDTILDSAILANEKSVNEFRSGKEKALNAIVGFVMKEIKSKNIHIVDPAFTVSTLLKQRLS